MKLITVNLIILIVFKASLSMASVCPNAFEKFEEKQKNLNELSFQLEASALQSSQVILNWYEGLKTWEGSRVHVPAGAFKVMQNYAVENRLSTKEIMKKYDQLTIEAQEIWAEIKKQCN